MLERGTHARTSPSLPVAAVAYAVRRWGDRRDAMAWRDRLEDRPRLRINRGSVLARERRDRLQMWRGGGVSGARDSDAGIAIGEPTCRVACGGRSECTAVRVNGSTPVGALARPRSESPHARSRHGAQRERRSLGFASDPSAVRWHAVPLRATANPCLAPHEHSWPACVLHRQRWATMDVLRTARRGAPVSASATSAAMTRHTTPIRTVETMRMHDRRYLMRFNLVGVC
jgi:hypothetical protein